MRLSTEGYFQNAADATMAFFVNYWPAAILSRGVSARPDVDRANPGKAALSRPPLAAEINTP